MSHPPKTLSAGFVIARCRQGQWCFLLLRAYRYWDFPKGQVQPGEAPLQAARREVKEETGLDTLALRWGECYHETPPYGRAKVARYYLAESRAGAVVLGISPELGRPEHHEYRWLSHDDASHLLVPRVRAALDWAVSILGTHCG